MQSLRKELLELEERGHFDKTIDQVQELIDTLTNFKDKIGNGEISRDHLVLLSSHILTKQMQNPPKWGWQRQV